MANAIKENEPFVWPCEEKNKLFKSLGKSIKDLTEHEWDTLLEHSAGCEICRQNDKVADFVMNRDMHETLEGLAEEMERIPLLKGLKRTN